MKNFVEKPFAFRGTILALVATHLVAACLIEVSLYRKAEVMFRVYFGTIKSVRNV